MIVNNLFYLFRIFEFKECCCFFEYCMFLICDSRLKKVLGDILVFGICLFCSYFDLNNKDGVEFLCILVVY